MGFVTLGLFTLTVEGVQGGLFQMISHGLISAALFLCVGVLYDRLHTREIGQYGGIVRNMPRFATVFMIFMLGSVGLPGTSGFVGEFLSLLGAFATNTLIAVLAATGVILGAAYMLRLYKRVVFGAVTNNDAGAMPDLNVREFSLLAPLVVLVLLLGVQPNLILAKTEYAVTALVTNYQTAITDKSGEAISLNFSMREIEFPDLNSLEIKFMEKFKND